MIRQLAILSLLINILGTGVVYGWTVEQAIPYLTALGVPVQQAKGGFCATNCAKPGTGKCQVDADAMVGVATQAALLKGIESTCLVNCLRGNAIQQDCAMHQFGVFHSRMVDFLRADLANSQRENREIRGHLDALHLRVVGILGRGGRLGAAPIAGGGADIHKILANIGTLEGQLNDLEKENLDLTNNLALAQGDLGAAQLKIDSLRRKKQELRAQIAGYEAELDQLVGLQGKLQELFARYQVGFTEDIRQLQGGAAALETRLQGFERLVRENTQSLQQWGAAKGADLEALKRELERSDQEIRDAVNEVQRRTENMQRVMEGLNLIGQ